MTGVMDVRQPVASEAILASILEDSCGDLIFKVVPVIYQS